MDLHIANLLRELVQKSPNVQFELKELVPVLEALASIVGSYAQEGEYKGVFQVSESDFHKAVRRDVRIRLVNDLQDHPNQAGGITDLRYKGGRD